MNTLWSQNSEVNTHNMFFIWHERMILNSEKRWQWRTINNKHPSVIDFMLRCWSCPIVKLTLKQQSTEYLKSRANAVQTNTSSTSFPFAYFRIRLQTKRTSWSDENPIVKPVCIIVSSNHGRPHQWARLGNCPVQEFDICEILGINNWFE